MLRFWDSRFHPDGNRGGVGVIAENQALPGYPIDATSIDATFEGCLHLLIKIDVEGHEYAVLRGMENTLQVSKVVMQIEIFEQQHDQVSAEVERLGLRLLKTIYPDSYLTNMDERDLGV